MGLKIKNIQSSCVLQGQVIPSAWSEERLPGDERMRSLCQGSPHHSQSVAS